MKVIFAKSIRKISDLNKDLLNSLKFDSRGITILYTIQYKYLAEKVGLYFKNKGKKCKIIQATGCSIIKSSYPILLISDGIFHAYNIASFNDKEVYLFNNSEIKKISREDIEKYNKLKKGKISKFLLADEVGILVSVKKGQNKLKEALLLKNQLAEKGKKALILLCDNISQEELENFLFPIYINTACPGLDKDNNKIINYSDVLKIIKK